MADVYKGLTIKLGVDDTSLSKALRSARSESIGVTSELKKIQKALKLDPGNTKLLSQQQQDYRKKIASTKKELDYLKQAESEIGKEDMGSDQWVNLQSDIVIAEQKLRGYKQALAETIIEQNVANSTLGKVGGAVERFGGKVEGIGRGMQSVGGALTRTLTPAIIGAGTATIIAATDIDTGLTNVKKTVDGTAEQYGELKQAAVDFSQTNAVSARQILDIQALGAQLGFSIDELDEFSRVVSGLDIATNMDAETAGTELARFANITKMSHGEIGNYGSAIVGLGNSFATTEGEISAMAMRIAASGEQVGMSQADILGVATALSSLGVEAEAGGTAVSTIMANIDKAIATNADSVSTWASAAQMSTDDFAAAWKNKPVDALAAVLSGMESATAEGGNMSVMLEELGIGSIRQTDVMKRLAGNSELVGKAVSKSNDEWSKNTALQKEVDNRNESLAAKFEILKNRVVAIADNVGGPLADALLDALDAAEPLFSAIADGSKAFADMDEDQQQLILTVVGLAAAFGPLMSIIGGGLTHIKGFGTGLQTVARHLANFDAYASSAGRAARVQAKEVKAASAATTGLSTSTKGASVAMGGLKAAVAGTGIGLLAIALGEVIGLVMKFVDANKDAADRQKNTAKAGEDLKKSLDGLDSGFDNANKKASDYSITADDVTSKTEELTQAHQDLAKSLSDTMTEAGSNAGMLESYMGVIETLGTKSNLTEQEQARLKDAVDRVNEACGTSFQVTNDQNGALAGQVDAIKAVVSAQQERLRYEAASEGLKQVYQQQEADLLEITRLEQQRNDLLEKNKGKTVAEQGADAQAYTETVNALNSARESYEATSETAKLYEDRVGEFGASLGSSAAEIGEFAASNSLITDALAISGQSVDGFIQALSQCGISTTELSSLSSENLSVLTSSYDGSVASIVSKLQEFGFAAKVEGENASAGLAEGISSGTEQAIAAAAEVTGSTIDQIKTDCAYFGIEGDEAIAAYANAIASGSPQAQAAAGAAGSSAGQGYSDALANKREVAVAAALQVTGMTLEQFNASATQAGVEGDEAVTAYANSISAGQGKSQLSASLNASSATGGFGTGDGATPGSQLGNRFANAVASARGTARSQGSNVADAAGGGMRSNNGSASSWGNHLVQNFASGISGMVSWAANAASAVANTVKNILGHTIPKAGPLRNGGKGEKEWGEHTIANYVSGVRSQIPALKKAMNEVSEAAAEPMVNYDRLNLATLPSTGARVAITATGASTTTDGGASKVYNININGLKYNDNATMRGIAEQIVVEIANTNERMWIE